MHFHGETRTTYSGRLVYKKVESNKIALDGGRLSEDGMRVISGLPLYSQKPMAERLWTPEQSKARKKRFLRRQNSQQLVSSFV